MKLAKIIEKIIICPSVGAVWQGKDTTKSISKATKEYLKELIGKDEEQYPSGYLRHEINIRNRFRAKLRKKAGLE